jgi:transposase
VVRARRALVAARTGLINHSRGAASSFGAALPACDARYFHLRIPAQLDPQLAPALTPVSDAIALLSLKIGLLDAAVEELISSRFPDARLLQQVPGVGPITALTFVLTIADPTRFRRSRMVPAYLGLTPARRQSGRRDPELPISKHGDPYLRQLLVECAHFTLSHRAPDSDLRRWALSLTDGTKGQKKRAVVATARRLAVLLHHLWVSGEVYEPLRRQAPPA